MPVSYFVVLLCYVPGSPLKTVMFLHFFGRRIKQLLL